MKIGVFDSGLGGLIIAKSLMDAMPQYDYAYLGDTANLPYGSRSTEVIYAASQRAVDWLFREQDCKIIIIACNTATIAALRRLQREYLPAHYPDRRILGIVVPTLETVANRGYRRVGLIATSSTVNSGVYEEELCKISPDVSIRAVATPLLVSLIENGGDKYAPEVLNDYLQDFGDCEALILGCTHYPRYKDLIRLRLPHVDVISQDEIMPDALGDYLGRHLEIESSIGRNGGRFFGITDLTKAYALTVARIFDAAVDLAKVEL